MINKGKTQKKDYLKPKLLIHGKISEITKEGSGVPNDTMGPS